MKMRKTVIALGAALILGLAGCGKQTQINVEQAGMLTIAATSSDKFAGVVVSENAVEITPSGDGFNVCFSLNTGDTKLMELNMYVVSRDQAELLKNNYLEDPTHLYSSILTALMLD